MLDILSMLESRVPKDGRRTDALFAANEFERDATREEARDEGFDSPGVRLGVPTPEDMGELILDPGPWVL